MEICSQHSSCTQTIMAHGERLAALETRIDRVEEVQADMVTQLEEAANGLRALAGKIDSAVSAAKKDGCQEVKVEGGEVNNESLTTSLNEAWKHFQKNFAMFVVYAAAGAFVWFLMKSITGDWNIQSNVVKFMHGLFHTAPG
jgi:hypothetical protein